MKIILLMLWSFALAVQVVSQEKLPDSKVVIDKDKPSVYLTFERLGGKKPRVKTDRYDSERITLRLHNNISRPIVVEANYDTRDLSESPITLLDGSKVGALPEGAEVELCYEAQAILQMSAEDFFKIQVPAESPYHYSCRWDQTRRGRGNSWIQSGSSIVFSLPREFLGKNLSIYTLFNYEWAIEDGQMKANEPRHQVFFYSTDLPYKLRPR